MPAAADACTTAPGSNEVTCTLRVEEGVWQLPHGIRFRTRLYNGVAPGPPIVVAPGDRLSVHLRNELGPNAPSVNDGKSIGFRSANTTILHIHGIYDDSLNDDTFTPVLPGEEKVYEYRIHPDTGSSLLWYHPHHEGSSLLQSIGGMAGAFIIADATQDALLGFDAPRRLLVLQSLHFDPASSDNLEKVALNDGCSMLGPRVVNPTGFVGMLLLVNGGEAPYEELSAGGWMRLQLINAMVDSTSAIVFGFHEEASERACSLRALAFDGVYLESARPARSLTLPSAGRVDLAVSCSTPGRHALVSLGSPGSVHAGGVVEAGHPIAVLRVVAEDARATETAPKLRRGPSMLPGPPPFYRNLLHAPPDGEHTFEFGAADGSNVVNGRLYDERPTYRMVQGSVQQWELVGGEGLRLGKLHPYHQHMSHFQIVRHSGYHAELGHVGDIGEWRDTLPLYRDLNYTIRFVAPPFMGLMMVHCHITKHAELGMMTLVALDPPRPPVAPSETSTPTTIATLVATLATATTAEGHETMAAPRFVLVLAVLAGTLVVATALAATLRNWLSAAGRRRAGSPPAQFDEVAEFDEEDDADGNGSGGGVRGGGCHPYVRFAIS